MEKHSGGLVSLLINTLQQDVHYVEALALTLYTRTECRLTSADRFIGSNNYRGHQRRTGFCACVERDSGMTFERSTKKIQWRLDSGCLTSDSQL